jgi:hypothetical protein
MKKFLDMSKPSRSLPAAQIATLILRHQRNESFKSRLLDTPLKSILPNGSTSSTLTRFLPYFLYHLAQIRRSCADEYCNTTPVYDSLPITVIRRVVWVLLEMGVSWFGSLYSKEWIGILTQSNMALFFLFPGRGGGYTIPERLLGIKFLQNFKNAPGETTKEKDGKYEIFGLMILAPVLYKLYSKLQSLGCAYY